MLKLHHHLLASASLALVGFAGVQQSDATTCNGSTNCFGSAGPGSGSYTFGSADIYGAGSTLIAPYWRQMSDCYGEPADLVQTTTATGTPTYVDEQLFNYTTAPAQNCATSHTNTAMTAWYISSGSGGGIATLYAHDSTGKWTGVLNTNGPQTLGNIMYAMSDAGLANSTDVACYNNGSCTEQGKAVIGTTATPCGSTGTYAIPASCFGPVIQYPISVDPVAIALPSKAVYEQISGAGKPNKSYSFTLPFHVLRLSENTLCGIFNRTITNWNDTHITADNGGTLLEGKGDPTPSGSWSVPINAVGRSDSSGTTSIFTRHIANICRSFPGNQFTDGATTLPSALQGNTYSVTSPNYPGIDQSNKITLAPGNAGVAQYVAVTTLPNGKGNQCPGASLPAGYSDCIQQARVGYLGADYVAPYVSGSQTNSYNLESAELQNKAGTWVKVSPGAALVAFTGINPPETTSAGKFCGSVASSTCSGGDRTDVGQWAESPSYTQPLAEPTAAGAYPLVGTTQVITYQCYADATQTANLVGELNYIDSAKINWSGKNILAVAGLAPMPKAWRSAISQAFLAGTDAEGLQIATVGSGGTDATACNAAGLTGG